MQCMEVKQKSGQWRRCNGVYKDMIMGKVEKGKRMVEFLKVEFLIKSGRKRDLAVIYVPPKTNIWRREEYGDMLKATCKCLRNMIENNGNIIMMGDFNCEEVCREE